MDIDRYIVTNQAGWQRLEDLTSRARGLGSRLSPDEIDELVAAYQRTSAQLSHVRTAYHDPALVSRLTRLVAAASAVIYGQKGRPVATLAAFFTQSFPGAVYHLRRFVLIAALVMFVPALLVAVWLLHDPAALDASGSPLDRQTYVDDQFEQYYSDQPSLVFFSQVYTNNVRVSFLAFALGALGAVPGALILAMNGYAVGQVAAWMIDAGEGGRFFTLILPHGLLELSAIVIAGAAGLALGWALLVPGDRTRTDALAEEGRRAAAVVLGLIATFGAAALIEGFVTGSGLPAAGRVGIGALAWLAFVLYLVVQGRAAAARGITGALGETGPGVGQSRPVALTSR